MRKCALLQLELRLDATDQTGPGSRPRRISIIVQLADSLGWEDELEGYSHEVEPDLWAG